MDCDKITYPTYKKAVSEMVGVVKRTKQKMRVYKCSTCGSFHLTTISTKHLNKMPKDKYKFDIEKAPKKLKFEEKANKEIPREKNVLHTEPMISKEQAAALKRIIEAKK